MLQRSKVKEKKCVYCGFWCRCNILLRDIAPRRQMHECDVFLSKIHFSKAQYSPHQPLKFYISGYRFCLCFDVFNTEIQKFNVSRCMAGTFIYLVLGAADRLYLGQSKLQRTMLLKPNHPKVTKGK